MKLIHGDCLEEMKNIPDRSIDMVLADPPYGTTACKWDSIIPLEPVWVQLKRVIKKNGAIVMTASQPFTTTLISSNIEMFKYCWVWDKKNPTNITMAKKQPLKYHEDIAVFYEKQSRYNPIKWSGEKNHRQGKSKTRVSESVGTIGRGKDDLSGMKYPRSILEISKHSSQGGLHPTQKPVALMEYLIKTYTNKGEIVLDFCMGSGTTGVACKNLNRNFIGIELDEKYFEIAKKRINEN